MVFLATLNVKGMTDLEKFVQILKVLSQRMIDCVFLTETHLTYSDAAKFRDRFPDILITTNSPSRNSAGVTFVSRNPGRVRWDENLDIFYKDNYGRALGIDVTIDPDHGKAVKKTRCLGVYMPNIDSEQISFIGTLMEDVNIINLDLMMGDFNMVESAADRNPPHMDNQGVVLALRGLLSKHRLSDGWSSAEPSLDKATAAGYTYQSSNSLQSSSRIDRIYAREKILVRSSDWRVSETPRRFDHLMVSFQFNPRTKIVRGKAAWRINAGYFKDAGYKASMTSILDKHAKQVTRNWLIHSSITTEGEQSNNSITERYATCNDPSKYPDTIKAWDELMMEVTKYAADFQQNKFRSRERKLRNIERRLKVARALPANHPKRALRVQAAQERLHTYTDMMETARQYNARAKSMDIAEGVSREFWNLADLTRHSQDIMGLKDPDSQRPDKIHKKPKRMGKIASK